MASPQVYDRFFININGSLQGEADTCNVEGQGDPIPIATFVKDFAGVMPVPKQTRVSVESFVPQTGMEFDAFKAWLKTQLVKIRCTFGGSGKSLVIEGFVAAPSIRSSATDPTKLSFALMCNASTFT